MAVITVYRESERGRKSGQGISLDGRNLQGDSHAETTAGGGAGDVLGGIADIRWEYGEVYDRGAAKEGRGKGCSNRWENIVIAEKNAEINEKNIVIAEKDAEIEALKRQLKELSKKENWQLEHTNE